MHRRTRPTGPGRPPSGRPHQLTDVPGGRHLWDIVHLPFSGPRPDQIRLVLDQAAQLPPGTGFLDLWRTRPGDADAPASVLPREPGISLVVAGIWTDAADDEHQVTRIERIAAALRASGLVGESPSASNHVSVHDSARVAARHGTLAYTRLQRIKATYDPDNVFRRNDNVPPAP